ncbi:MAG TPA: (Fe-S)-binding protein, partial [Anaerolineales bacterium]|nr:(Fe-S)-binding protein [Anaerolineales bacterium]
MLTLPERIIFILAVIASGYAAWVAANRIYRTIQRGHGEVDWAAARDRLATALAKTLTLQPTFRLRLGPSIFHAFIAWAFIYYLLVNVVDVLRGFFPELAIPGALGFIYRLIADLLSVGALVGMTALLLRRFVFKPPALHTRDEVLLNPKARAGIRRDSLIVGVFILVHVGARFLGEAVRIALEGADAAQPFATLAAGLFTGLGTGTLVVLEHVFFWLALGTILAFVPYFLYSKHLHLIFTPLNYWLTPKRRSMGELDRLDFEDETIELFGAARLEDLGYELIMDAYACIMCYRCQEVCPAYNTGKVLSPAAMEINKRYFLNQEGKRLAQGEPSSQTLVEFAIPEEAIWACTACGACVDICPVGNEPMRDILQIRRNLVLVENDFPDQLQTAFRGMERTVNPWNVPPQERMKWAAGYDVPTIETNPEPEILWWVGCAPATDARAQKTAQAFAQVLNHAQVNYAVLGQNEQCTGDSARRAGMEYLFDELAMANVELLNDVAPQRIVTTCPHCLHTLKNEYPEFGGNYEVIHHSQLINELVATGRLKINPEGVQKMTFHDPCYLSRHNDIVAAPRTALQATSNAEMVEMPRHGRKSFCCGAGGAQMWKEEEEGDQRVNANRMAEAVSTGADVLAVGCPFCMIMLT